MLNFLEENKDITDLSNFRTRASTRYFFEIKKEEDISKIVEIKESAEKNNLKILFVGGGTNMLFAFDCFDGVIIKNSLEGFSYDKNTKILELSSNEVISEVASKLELEYGQNLWHRFIGLPGSVGGAIYGNAGCFGLETESNMIDIVVLNMSTGKIEIIKKEEASFSYRSSIFKESEKYFIISARFDLSKKVEKYHSDVDNLHFREYKQPNGNTCGSFFKNPNREQSAGFLIEQVGLKGYKIGTAYFSEKHANFLMSDDFGNSKDLLKLIKLAQEKIKKEFHLELINEVRIIKN